MLPPTNQHRHLTKNIRCVLARHGTVGTRLGVSQALIVVVYTCKSLESESTVRITGGYNVAHTTCATAPSHAARLDSVPHNGRGNGSSGRRASHTPCSGAPDERCEPATELALTTCIDAGWGLIGHGCLSSHSLTRLTRSAFLPVTGWLLLLRNSCQTVTLVSMLGYDWAGVCGALRCLRSNRRGRTAWPPLPRHARSPRQGQ